MCFVLQKNYGILRNHGNITIRFLVRVSPNGFSTFLSYCYGDMASDKYITKDSVFYILLQRGNQLMADRGFQIEEELLFHF